MSGDTQKNILFISHDGWPTCCRFPKAAHDAGFIVSAAAFRHAPIYVSKFVDTQLIFPEGIQTKNHILSVFGQACLESKADIVMPCDERSVLLLAELYEEIKDSDDADKQKLCELILFSRGKPEFFTAVLSKAKTVDLAERRMNILTPGQQVCGSADEVADFAKANQYPLVLKGEHGNAGVLVRICQNESEARREFEELHKFGEVIAQRYIEGAPCMANAVALNGKMLASVTFEKVECYPDEKGPSSVVKIINNKKIAAATELFIKHTGYSGILSLDYMLDKKGNPYLIECNPRPTPVSHLGAVTGVDLFAALYAGLNAEEYKGKVEKDKMIALFPKEWRRDKTSAYLSDRAYHDVPWDQPEIIRFYMKALGEQL